MPKIAAKFELDQPPPQIPSQVGRGTPPPHTPPSWHQRRLQLDAYCDTIVKQQQSIDSKQLIAKSKER